MIGAENAVRSTPTCEADNKRRESEVRAASDLLTRQQILNGFQFQSREGTEMKDQRTLKNIIKEQREEIVLHKKAFGLLWIESCRQSEQIMTANEILEKWCKECQHDNFGNCENDCGIHNLKKLLLNPRLEKQGEGTDITLSDCLDCQRRDEDCVNFPEGKCLKIPRKEENGGEKVEH